VGAARDHLADVTDCAGQVAGHLCVRLPRRSN
jgi:hypothetical protein